MASNGRVDIHGDRATVFADVLKHVGFCKCRFCFGTTVHMVCAGLQLYPFRCRGLLRVTAVGGVRIMQVPTSRSVPFKRILILRGQAFFTFLKEIRHPRTVCDDTHGS